MALRIPVTDDDFRSLTSFDVQEIIVAIDIAEENGDLNLDPYPDKILVLSPHGEDSLSTQEKPLLRLLVMLYGTKKSIF
jgi:hypothetical protein